MNIALIAAIAKNGAIGHRGGLPWPPMREDMAHFRRVTMGGVVIMGRHTWDSLPPKLRPLPDRYNIVVTSRPIAAEWDIHDGAGFDFVPSLDAALDVVGDDQAFVIGGARLYREALDRRLVDTVHLTEVDLEPPHDVHLKLDLSGFDEVERRKGETPELTFVTLRRKL